MFNHITLIFICLYLEAYNLKLTFNNLSNGRNANYVYISSMADCIFPRQLHQYISHSEYSYQSHLQFLVEKIFWQNYVYMTNFNGNMKS